jgi:RNA polymerase sigma-70 factor (ECF subfamily)
MNLQDAHILRRIKKGDLKHFENLFHQHYPGMCSYAEALLKSEMLAEEIVQDVFYNVWKNKDNLKLRGNWNSYLYKAVYNNSMAYLRKMKREVLSDEIWENEKEFSSDPEQEMQLKEIKATIIKTLDELPERTSEIYNLNRNQGLKYTEIAERLSISVKTVEANMSRAIKALRASLREYSS